MHWNIYCEALCRISDSLGWYSFCTAHNADFCQSLHTNDQRRRTGHHSRCLIERMLMAVFLSNCWRFCALSAKPGRFHAERLVGRELDRRSLKWKWQIIVFKILNVFFTRIVDIFVNYQVIISYIWLYYALHPAYSHPTPTAVHIPRQISSSTFEYRVLNQIFNWNLIIASWKNRGHPAYPR